MKQSNANRKVNEQARQILASILLFEVSDPRFALINDYPLAKNELRPQRLRRFLHH